MGEILTQDFYERDDVVQIARELIGCRLVSEIGGQRTEGRIVETEAYCGATDKACHAHLKRTKRTEIMYGAGGRAYVYLCYGIHSLFNIVTNRAGAADAVLIRAVEPLEGAAVMLERRGFAAAKPDLSNGPGKVTQAFGIDRGHNTLPLFGAPLWLEHDHQYIDSELIASCRVGIGYAKDDAHLPWRFRLRGNRFAGNQNPEYPRLNPDR